MQSLYDLDAVAPMERELSNVGVTPLKTPGEVDAALGGDFPGTTLRVINSVCGCAASSCRPGVTRALQHRVIPDRLFTVFAGVDISATARARRYLPDGVNSSPNVMLFRAGTPVCILTRQDIEIHEADGLAAFLVDLFERECGRPGPSAPPEAFARNEPVNPGCSAVPPYRGN